MPSKYPSVTASSRGAAARKSKPANFPKGKPVPANDNKIGLVKVGKAALRRTPSPLRWIPDLIQVAEEVGDMFDRVSDISWLVRPGANGMNSAYWTQTCSTGARDFRWTGGTLSFGCGLYDRNYDTLNPAAADLTADMGTSVSTSYVYFFRDKGDNPGHPDPRYRVAQLSEKWSRKVGAPIPTPLWQSTPGAVVPVPLAEPLPMAWPLSVPLRNPSAVPAVKPVPYESPKPGEEPSAPRVEVIPSSWAVSVNGAFTHRWTVPRRRAHPRLRPRVQPPLILPPVPAPLVVVHPQPGQPPVVFPGAALTFDPGTGRTVFERTTDYGKDRPPPKRVKEHKVEKRSRLAGIAFAGINSATEFIDFVVAMHASIADPGEKLDKKASKAQVIRFMLSDIRPWGHIDPAEGLQNYINMQVGDYVAALGSRQVKHLTQELGIETGLDRGINAGRKYDQELGPGYDPIPKLDIDLQNGVIAIEGPLGVLTFKL